MLLSSILPAALALGAEEVVDSLETDKVETVVVIESEENGDENKDTDIELGNSIKINSDKNSFVENVEKIEDNAHDGDESQSSEDGFQSDLPPPSGDIKNTIVKKEDNQKVSISNPPDDDCAPCDSGYIDTQDAACSSPGECSSTCAEADDNAKDKPQEPVRKQITKDEYDKFEDKFSSNNDEVIIASGLKLVTSAHDGWWIHVDETAPKGTLTIAYKISSEYFMVAFTITESGSHFIGDGRKSGGVNHIKIGFVDAERGEDNLGNDELKPEPKPDPDPDFDPKDNSKKKQSDNIKENKKLRQNQGTNPEPKVDPDPKPSPDSDKPNEGTSPEPDAEIEPESTPNTGTGQSSDRGSSSNSSLEADFEAEPEQAPVSNPEDDSSTNSESEGSISEGDKTVVPVADEGNNPLGDIPTREARTGSSTSPKTGEIASYHHLLAFASAVIAAFSAGGLIRIRIEEI